MLLALPRGPKNDRREWGLWGGGERGAEMTRVGIETAGISVLVVKMIGVGDMLIRCEALRE